MQNHSTKNVSDGSRTCIQRIVYVPTSRFLVLLKSHYLTEIRSTMAWGLEARVPFLDKAFLEVAMTIDPKEKMFSKGSAQEVDADGRPKMEKVCLGTSVVLAM